MSIWVVPRICVPKLQLRGFFYEPEESNYAPEKSNPDTHSVAFAESKSAFCAAEKSNPPKRSFAFAESKSAFGAVKPTF